MSHSRKSLSSVAQFVFMFILLAVSVGLYQCSPKKDAAPAPTVSFTFSPAAPTTLDAVQFTSTAQNATSFAWSSNPAGFTSTQANPTFTFPNPGTYQVTVTATGEGGNVSATQTVTVTAPRPTGDFTFTPASPVAGQAVQFTATAQNATGFAWSSDPTGFTSTVQNPTFTFATAGTYRVTLQITGGGGTNSVTKTVTVAAPAPAVDFTFDPASPATGQEVSFTATAQNATTFAWSSVPAGFTADTQNPKFTFATAGTYQVTLRATGPGGSTNVTKPITVTAGVSANFTFAPAEPEAGQEITFTNQSVNATTFAWDFGNGQTSTQQNPRLTYGQAGTFNVRLTARGASGEVSVTKAVLVKTAGGGGGPCADANPCNLPLCFPTRLEGNITNNFGPGGVSSTLLTTFDYVVVAGKRVVSRLVATTTTAGIAATTTTTYTYDAQARTTRSVAQTQAGGVTSTVTTDSEYNGCRKTRDVTSVNGTTTASTTFVYDAQGRLTRQNELNAAGQITSYTVFSNFSAQGLSQTQESFEANGTRSSTTTITYQNCQPLRLIGRNEAGQTVLDQTSTFNAQGLIGRSVTTSSVTQGGVSIATTITVDFQYQCF